MTTRRYTAAALRFDLTASWSHTNGVGYIHQTVLDTAIVYLYVPLNDLPAAAKVKRVAVFCTPAAHAGIEPGNFPKVSVYGLGRDGTATLLAEADDTDLTGFRFDLFHVIGSTGAHSWESGAHVHEGRGVPLDHAVASYYALQLRVRGESGSNSVLGLRLESVEVQFG